MTQVETTSTWQDVFDFVFETKGPAIYTYEIVRDKIKEFFTSGIESMAYDIIAGLPIMVGVSVAVYALVSMMSKRLAKLGVIGVFIYGSFVAVF